MRLPAIDLHMHLEGSLPLHVLASLARRHRRPVPPLRGWRGLPGFLKAFGAVCDLLSDEEDFEAAAHGVLAAARSRGVVHAEVLFSPQVFLRRGVALETIVRGLLRGRSRALRAGGMSACFIADGVRQWGGEWLEEVVRALAPYVGIHVAGVGVGGDEAAAPAGDFVRAFRLARRLGLRTTVHAGETQGPRAVREALDHLGPDRIGHGVGAAGDPRLLRRLARGGVVLEVCPTSNLATGAVPGSAPHPVRRLVEAGVRVAIGSDDGLFFGTDTRRELLRLAGRHGLSGRQIAEVGRTAARAAFLGRGARAALERRVRAAAARAGAA